MSTELPPSSTEWLEGTEALIDRVRSGDRAALDALLRRYVRPLSRWASGRLPRWARDLSDTDDLVQETLVASLRHVDRFERRGHGSLHAYLREAVTNRIRDELRRHARRPRSAAVDDRLRDGAASPLEEAIGVEALARFEDGLARLSAHDREAVIARVELGLEYGDIADILGKRSADAARMTVTRALLRLAEEMGRG